MKINDRHRQPLDVTYSVTTLAGSVVGTWREARMAPSCATTVPSTLAVVCERSTGNEALVFLFIEHAKAGVTDRARTAEITTVNFIVCILFVCASAALTMIKIGQARPNY
jgi:hypothetical protein